MSSGRRYRRVTRTFAGGESHVRGRWVRMQIVGVVAQELGTGDLLVPIERRNFKACVGSCRRRPGPFRPADVALTALVVVADGLNHVPDVRQEITDVGYSTSAPITHHVRAALSPRGRWSYVGPSE